MLATSTFERMSPRHVVVPPSSPSPAPSIVERVVPHVRIHSPSSYHSGRWAATHWQWSVVIVSVLELLLWWQILLISVEWRWLSLRKVSVSSSESIILWSSSSRRWKGIVHGTTSTTTIHLPRSAWPKGAVSSTRIDWSSTPASATIESGIDPLIIHFGKQLCAIRCVYLKKQIGVYFRGDSGKGIKL